MNDIKRIIEAIVGEGWFNTTFSEDTLLNILCIFITTIFCFFQFKIGKKYNVVERLKTKELIWLVLTSFVFSWAVTIFLGIFMTAWFTWTELWLSGSTVFLLGGLSNVRKVKSFINEWVIKSEW